jgi:general secretion pathway protein N
MISRLDANPLGKVLAWVSAGLVTVLLLLGVAWVLPPSGAGNADGDGSRNLSSEVPQLGSAQPIEKYAEITDRPVFNESRQPVIGADSGDDEEEFTGLENVDAPDVELAGVVITPDIRVATLRLKDSPESLLAYEGQPLEGDFGSWHISRIEAREAILESASGEQVRLELQIHDAVIDEPPEVKEAREVAAREVAANESTQSEQQGEQPMTRAEEIRQRIAERREELRRAAEEGGDAEEQQQQSAPVDYRQAIQQMMQGRKNQDQDESEQ